LEDVRLNVGE
jgi:hypothetical protein